MITIVAVMGVVVIMAMVICVSGRVLGVVTLKGAAAVLAGGGDVGFGGRG